MYFLFKNMSKANVTFTLDGVDVTIQCSPEEKMKAICQRYGTKVNTNTDSLLFLYGGNQLNFDLKFEEQANSMDKSNNEMKVLVYKKVNDDLVCPKCGEKIKLNTEKLDEILSTNDNIKNTINGIKATLDLITNAKNSSVNLINIQISNIIIILNKINEDIQKNNEKLKN